MQTELSEIVPSDEQPFAFLYVYDFGDYWVHEVQFEGPVKAETIRQPPICLEGERACPPEDVGGIWGYENFLEAITDPDHEEHEHYVEWGRGMILKCLTQKRPLIGCGKAWMIGWI